MTLRTELRGHSPAMEPGQPTTVMRFYGRRIPFRSTMTTGLKPGIHLLGFDTNAGFNTQILTEDFEPSVEGHLYGPVPAATASVHQIQQRDAWINADQHPVADLPEQLAMNAILESIVPTSRIAIAGAEANTGRAIPVAKIDKTTTENSILVPTRTDAGGYDSHGPQGALAQPASDLFQQVFTEVSFALTELRELPMACNAIRKMLSGHGFRLGLIGFNHLCAIRV